MEEHEPMKKKERTIFREIFIPLLCVLAFEMLFMMGTIIFGGAIEGLDRNVADMQFTRSENNSSVESADKDCLERRSA